MARDRSPERRIVEVIADGTDRIHFSSRAFVGAFVGVAPYVVSRFWNIVLTTIRVFAESHERQHGMLYPSEITEEASQLYAATKHLPMWDDVF